MSVLEELVHRARIHVFDVDHTLTRHSTGRFFVEEGWRSGDFRFGTLASVPFYYLLYRLGTISLATVDREVRFVAGKSRKHLERIARRSFNRRVRQNIYSAAREHVRRILDAGGRILAASTSFDFILAPLLEDMAIREAIATVAEFDAGVATGLLDGGPCYGTNKRDRTLSRVRELGFEPGDCAFYTDSFHDLPLLAEVGHPVAVHPDRRLRRVAKFEDWPIVCW